MHFLPFDLKSVLVSIALNAALPAWHLRRSASRYPGYDLLRIWAQSLFVCLPCMLQLMFVHHRNKLDILSL
jgi:hypothetical protein